MQANATVAVMGYLRVAPERVAELRPAMHAIVEATNRLDGCILYRAVEDPIEPGTLRFFELWPDQATFDRHLRAAHVAPWRAALAHCGQRERKFLVFDITGAREL